jgi:hypothetical protein
MHILLNFCIKRFNSIISHSLIAGSTIRDTQSHDFEQKYCKYHECVSVRDNESLSMYIKNK